MITTHHNGILRIIFANGVDGCLCNPYPRSRSQHIMRFVDQAVTVQAFAVFQFSGDRSPSRCKMIDRKAVAYDAVLTIVLTPAVIVHIDQYLHVALICFGQ